MRTLTTNFETPTQVQEALAANGFSVDGTPGEVKEPNSEPTDKPGEATPEKPVDGSAPPSEAGEKPKQEPQDGKPVEATPVEPKPNEGKPEGKRHDFESRRRKLERQIDALETNLDLERGSKSKLQTELAAAQAELAKFKPAEPAKPEGPVKPVRPKRADFEYDDDRLELAMAEYEEKRDAYDEAMRAKAATDAVAASEEKRRKEAETADAERQLREFVEKVVANAKELELNDYDELLGQMPEEPVHIGKSAEAAIGRSKNSALLIHYFMKDVVEGDGSESVRFSRMDGVDQVLGIRELEQKLLAERSPKAQAAAPNGEPPKAEVKPPVEPAKPKPAAARPPDPIAPLSGRAVAGTPGLEGLSGRDYRAARAAGVNRP